MADHKDDSDKAEKGSTDTRVDDASGEVEQPLNPRIVKGLNDLYSGIVNDPLPDKITNILDKLRDEERKLREDGSKEPAGGNE